MVFHIPLVQYFQGNFFSECWERAACFHISDLASALSESHLKGQEIQIPILLSKSKGLINSFSNPATKPCCLLDYLRVLFKLSLPPELTRSWTDVKPAAEEWACRRPFEKLSAAKQTALSQELPSWKHRAVADLDKKNKLESRKQNESDPTEREFL